MLIIYAGKNSFMWFGPTPRVILTDPELVKEVFNKIYDFQKPNTNPLVRILATGLIIHEGEKWNKHRKIINPAFHLEKLKVSFSLLAVTNYKKNY
jgi:cytochrome P450